MQAEKSLETLNTLIIIHNDRIEGYERASRETEETYLKQLFAELIQTSLKCKTELISEVLKSGGKPDEGTSASGKFYHAWMDLKAALSGKNRKVILNSCETGEDAAISAYENALAQAEYLTDEQRAMISNQLSFIRADHNKIIRLRDTILEHK